MKIDFHLHLMKRKEFIRDTLESMDETGVEKSMLVALSNWINPFWPEHLGHETAGNEDVLKAVKENPTRFIGCIYVDPREKHAVDTVNKYWDLGFKCIKMYPPIGFYPDDPSLSPVFEHINKLGIPILFHVGQTRSYSVQKGKKIHHNSAFSEPMHIDMLIRRYPNIRFILAHWGFPWYIQTLVLADKHSNVYIDTSPGDTWTMNIVCKLYNALDRSIPIHFDRVIWGTDNIKTHRQSMNDTLDSLKEMDFPPTAENRIFGETAREILGL